MTKKHKLLTALVFAALIASAVTAIAAVDVDGKFELFGHAKWVTGGPAPGEKAIDLTSDCTGSNCNYSGVAFIPKAGHTLILSDITTLSADFNVGGSDCGGGSPRFEIDFADKNNIFVYFGPYPNFTNCFFGWQNTGNVIGTTALIWDTSKRGGTFYDTHAHALTFAGSEPITSISVVVDSGWFTPRGQDATIAHYTINDNVFPRKDQEGEEHWK